MAHSRKIEHQTIVLHDGYRPVSLEASPFSLETQGKTRKKTQKMVLKKKVKSSER
jgi:hypothetical protein